MFDFPYEVSMLPTVYVYTLIVRNQTPTFYLDEHTVSFPCCRWEHRGLQMRHALHVGLKGNA